MMLLALDYDVFVNDYYHHRNFLEICQKEKHTARNSRYVISHFMTVTWRFLTHPICPRRRRSLNLTKLLIVVFSERDTL